MSRLEPYKGAYLSSVHLKHTHPVDFRTQTQADLFQRGLASLTPNERRICSMDLDKFSAKDVRGMRIKNQLYQAGWRPAVQPGWGMLYHPLPVSPYPYLYN